MNRKLTRRINTSSNSALCKWCARNIDRKNIDMSLKLASDHTIEDRFPLGKDGASEIVDYLEESLSKEQIKNAYYRVSVKAKIKQNNKILLVREDGKKWDLPGGGVEHDETIEQALERELKEEVGLLNFKIDTPPKIFKMIDKSANRPLLFIVFEFTIEDGATITHPKNTEVKLFEFSDVSDTVEYSEEYKNYIKTNF